uniref:Uncharacterized protein n=1 Tax=Plectus sambesii TaxID=2011161 RepID=A0A914WS22_9BILA
MSSNAAGVIALFLVATIFASQWSAANAAIDFTVCARMDDNPFGMPIGKEIAAKACIVACSIQNCGTGKCQKRSGKKTCVCNRCANGGGSIPVGK